MTSCLDVCLSVLQHLLLAHVFQKLVQADCVSALAYLLQKQINIIVSPMVVAPSVNVMPVFIG